MIVGPKCKNPISLRVQVTNISFRHGRARLLSSYFCFIELLGELLDFLGNFSNAPLLRTVFLAGRSLGLHEAAPAVPGAATWLAAAVSGWEGYQRKSGFYRFSFVKIWLTLAFNNVQLVHHIAVKYGLATLIRKSAAFSEQILFWKFYEIVSWSKLVNWSERIALLWLGAWVLFLGIAWVHMAAFFLLGLQFWAALHYFFFLTLTKNSWVSLIPLKLAVPWLWLDS